MTFRDIFKSSFLENMDSVPLLDMAIALVLSFLLGLFIFAVYKQCYAGVMYSPSFGVTLVALSLITTLLILTVVSNIVLSLGMVGALSIVRFRTAVKEPMDIAFLFWAIAVGIVLAAGLLVLAVGGSPVHWGGAAGLFQAQGAGDALHPPSPLPGGAGGAAGPGLCGLPGKAAEFEKQSGGKRPGGAEL